MQIQPVQSYLYCSIHEGKTTSLHLPQGAEIQPYAKVVAAGPECKRYVIGDMVLFSPQNIIFIDETPFGKFVIVPESCVFATYLPEPAGWQAYPVDEPAACLD